MSRAYRFLRWAIAGVGLACIAVLPYYVVRENAARQRHLADTFGVPPASVTPYAPFGPPSPGVRATYVVTRDKTILAWVSLEDRHTIRLIDFGSGAPSLQESYSPGDTQIRGAVLEQMHRFWGNEAAGAVITSVEVISPTTYRLRIADAMGHVQWTVRVSEGHIRGIARARSVGERIPGITPKGGTD